jgi:hypothetical protein
MSAAKSDPQARNTELPEGAFILTSAQEKGTGDDVELAVGLARLGASPLAVRALGGEEEFVGPRR